MARETHAIPYPRKYRVRWLGFPSEQDTWEPRFSLLRDIPDVVRAYELLDSSHPVSSANVNPLLLYEIDMVMQEIENENDDETKNVVVTGYHHDRENDTSLRSVRRHGQANESPPYTEQPTETGSVVESYDASAVRHA